MNDCYECEFLLCEPPSLAVPEGGREVCAKDVKPESTGECLEFQKRTAPHITFVELCDYTPTKSDIQF